MSSMSWVNEWSTFFGEFPICYDGSEYILHVGDLTNEFGRGLYVRLYLSGKSDQIYTGGWAVNRTAQDNPLNRINDEMWQMIEEITDRVQKLQVFI